ncbi:MAG: hypothetical protein GEU89_18695 [Kiloniellaceae bacterium]|nr:hypothetical protein [Kiloniellaceae bacterium]
MRAPFHFRFLCLFLTIVGGLWPLAALGPVHAAGSPAAAVADPATPAAQGEEVPRADPASSPWEHPLWHNATTAMRLYVCEHARRAPSWCGATPELPDNAALPTPQGPPLLEEDAEWLAFLETAEPASLSPQQVVRVRRRATEQRDPQAMEILGYLHAEGLSVGRDYAEAYRWYGLAFLSGEKRVQPNMEVVWQLLQRSDLEGAMALTREFDALAQGEVPASLLLPPAEAPAEIPAAAATK